jgi:hypothetical protein
MSTYPAATVQLAFVRKDEGFSEDWKDFFLNHLLPKLRECRARYSWKPHSHSKEHGLLCPEREISDKRSWGSGTEWFEYEQLRKFLEQNGFKFVCLMPWCGARFEASSGDVPAAVVGKLD